MSWSLPHSRCGCRRFALRGAERNSCSFGSPLANTRKPASPIGRPLQRGALSPKPNAPLRQRFGLRRDFKPFGVVSTAAINIISSAVRSSSFFQTYAIRPEGETERKSGCGTCNFSEPANTMLKGSNGAACQNFLSSVAVIVEQSQDARRASTRHPLNSAATSVALWPPKPNELFATTQTFFSRATLGV